MDTDDDESEIDDGEEEQRVQRRQRRLPKSAGREIMSTIEIDMTIDRDMRKKPIIEFRLPQQIGSSSRVCI